MNIKVSAVAFSKNLELVKRLKLEFPNSVVNEEGRRFNRDELIEYFYDASAVIVGLEKIDAQLLDELPNLKIIAKYGVGLDNIDLKACKEKNIAIGWTGGVNKESVAEMVVGFMLMLNRNLFLTSTQLKDGIWNKSGGFLLSNKTIGIIGLGNIGQAVVKMLAPFNCKIIANDIADVGNFANAHNVEIVNKEVIFEKSDFVTIHTPLNNETRHLINRKTFSLMKKTAFIINTARGGIINEEDLKIALMNKAIAGAALDVYEEEPPVDLELLKMDNLICTPHIGGNAYESVIAMGETAIEHLVAFNKQKSTWKN